MACPDNLIVETGPRRAAIEHEGVRREIHERQGRGVPFRREAMIARQGREHPLLQQFVQRDALAIGSGRTDERHVEPFRSQ